MIPATSYTSRTYDYGWPSRDWSANYQQESYHSGYLSRDYSFTSTAASETSTTGQTPSNGEYSFEVGVHQPQIAPLDYWGANQNGASTSAFYTVGLEFSHHCATTPTYFYRGAWTLFTGQGLVKRGPR